MKRNHIVLLTLTLLLLLFFVGCNADASEGLFRQIQNSKEPVKISYKQIIGRSSDEKTLYFLTESGVFSKVAGADAVTVKANTSGEIAESAALIDDTTLCILVNGPGSSGVILAGDPADSDSFTKLAADDTYNLKGLYANGKVLAQEKSGANPKVHLGTVDASSGAFASTINLSDISSTGSWVGMLTHTGTEQEDFGSDNPILSIFYNPQDKKYLTYYSDGTNHTQLTDLDNKHGKPATFTLLEGKLFVLTESGVLYGAEKPKTTDATKKMKELVKLNREYSQQAFLYGMKTTDDENNDTLHLISKSKRSVEGFTVLSFAPGLLDAAEKKITVTPITKGYGRVLPNTTYVDTMLINETATELKFLVATYSNGMVDITIKNPSLDEKDTNGSSSNPEEYEF